ncbi:MAG: DSD1 family PLP-dependent enzyme [Burkholderiales bacterium]|nr:DSD1 family PLP-dependent enzyme [Burkholderiales bacterium]
MSQAPPARAGDPIDAIDTPALVLELAAFEANLEAMAAFVRGSGVRLRPHAKSHKCPEIAKRQIALGAVGVCAQKTSEAEAFVDAGIGDVFVSNEVVGRAKLERLARLARRAKVSVCCDDAANARDIAAAAQAAGSTVEVFVEVDVGQHRCGVAPGEPAVALAAAIASAPGLRFAGLHAYHGGAQHLRAVAERRAAVAQAAALARDTRARIESRGIACPLVTGGGTGTFAFEMASGVYGEIQPGSYVFMDADYNRNAWADAGAALPSFAQSLFVLATVMSAPAADRAVVDAGLKASSVDSGMPILVGWPGVAYAKASDEHGVLAIAPGARGPAPGERVRLVPGHCDPTVNLYDWIVCVRGDRVEAVWPITARGALA